MLKGLYLTLMVGPTVPTPVPKVVLDALESIQVRTTAGQASGFQLTFSLSNRSPLHTIFLVTAGRKPLLRVIAVVTINGIPQVLIDGVTTSHQVTPGGESGQSTLTITGDDLTRIMDLQDYSGVPFPSMPPEARIALIIAKYAVFGMIPMVIPSPFSDTPLVTDRTPSQKSTDLNYIRQLAERVGHVFYIEPGPAPGTNVAYWGPEVKVGVPQPALNLDMDAHTNVESLSFSFNTANTSLPIVYVQIPTTNVAIPVPIPKVSPLQPPLGAIPAPITNVTMLNETAKLSSIEAIGRGLAEASRSADAVSANGTLDVLRYGRPLKARRLVGVRGAGMAFDGLYYTKSVTSTIKRGEFKQQFELTRNGLVSITPAVPA